jgi:hypothetical protein
VTFVGVNLFLAQSPGELFFASSRRDPSSPNLVIIVRGFGFISPY